MDRFCVFLLFFVLHSFAFAESETLFQTGEEEAVEMALDIVEGKVVGGTVERQVGNRSCFSFVYEIKVDKSYKGRFKKNDLVKVGLNLNSIAVEPGQNQLIALVEPSEDFYDFCRSGSVNKDDNIKITFGYLVGVFEIFSDLAGNKKYRGVSCSDKKPVMYEDYAENKEWITGSCYQVVGNYDDLRAEIHREVGRLKGLEKQDSQSAGKSR